MSRLAVRPVTLGDARAFVARHHSHHRAHVGHRVSLGAFVAGRLVAVVVLGNPVAAPLDDGEQPEPIERAVRRAWRRTAGVLRRLEPGSIRSDRLRSPLGYLMRPKFVRDRGRSAMTLRESACHALDRRG